MKTFLFSLNAMANIIFHAAFEKFGENIMQTDQSYALSLPMLDLIEMA